MKRLNGDRCNGGLGFEAEFDFLNAGADDAADLDIGTVDGEALALFGHMSG